ncbi:Fe-S cluster assembly protein SufD [Candidatus Woesearchaeota archaeon]|nr:Fe-S cluster assembly protein SufD [Candidatus Woesearchaeota archaeon]
MITIQKTIRELSEPFWLKRRRADALNKFEILPNPSFRYGINIVLNASSLDLNSISSDLSQEESSISAEKEVEILSIHEAIKKYPQLTEIHFGSLISENEDKIAALHLASWNKGIFIKIPKNTELKKPIEISTNIRSKTQFEHILIIAEDNVKAAVIENTTSESEEGYRSNVVELIIGNNSQIQYGSLQSIKLGWHNFTINRAKLGNDSHLEWFSGNFGSKFTRFESTSLLNGRGSSTKNLGAFFASKAQQFDIFTSAIHAAPNTTSDMLVKGAAQDKAKSLYRGLIEIKENAPYSNGYQKQDTLLLNEGVESNAIPKLLIGNNEVRCTHGATIGQIDKKKIFYLMSRGLSEKEAERELVKGFFNPLIGKISNVQIKDYIESVIEERLK